MENNILFREMEKITTLAILALIVFSIMIGIGIKNALAPPMADLEEKNNTATVASIEYPPEIRQGKTLFLDNCASCHDIDMVNDMTGPALKDVTERWKKYPNDLYKWIQDPQGLAASGHPKAQQIAEWSDAVMTAFPNLDSSQIDCILAYIEQ